MINVINKIFKVFEFIANCLGWVVIYMLIMQYSTIIANLVIAGVLVMYVVKIYVKSKADKMFNEIWKEGIKSVDEIDVEELAKAFKNTISKAINNG